MSSHNKENLENIFIKAIEEVRIQPSVKVLRNLRFKLWKADFFRFHYGKFNVYYSLLLFSGMTAFIIVQNRYTAVSEADIDNNVNSVKIEVSDDISNREKHKENQIVDKETVSANGTADLNNTLPVAKFSASDLSGCAPLNITFQNNSIHANTCSWDFGNGQISTLFHPSVVYKIPGKYVIKLEIADKHGKRDSYTKEIIVHEKPLAQMEINVEKSEIGSRTLSFNNQSTGAASYEWDFGDQTKSEGKNARHTYSDFGIYSVCLIAKSEDACSDTSFIENRFLEKNYELSFPFVFKTNSVQLGNDGYYEKAGANTSIFYPKNFGAREYELRINAPNGIPVFQTRNIKQGWNGYVKARLAPSGIYSYYAKGIYPNGKPFNVAGKLKVITEDYYPDYAE